MTSTTVETTTGYELKITRVFDAPRELVWKAWTDPEMAKHWSGPRGFAVTKFSLPCQVGEPWALDMEGNVPQTKHLATLSQGGTVLEFDPPRKLKYTFAWSERSHVGLPPSPFKENVVTVVFEEQGRKTVMTFTQGPFATEGERDGHNGGWNSAFDKFAEFMLASQPYKEPDPNSIPTELHLKRFFSAPRQLVYDAWTKPEMLREWWGPANFTNPVCEIDAQQGGAMRIHMLAPDGTVYPMTGKFIEVYPTYRFHFISTPLDKEGNAIFTLWNSVFLEEVEGGTQMTLDVHVMNATELAPQFLKGMTAGWTQSLERLAALVNSASQRAE